jgi:hypothetical protein
LKKIFNPALLVIMSATSLALQSCQKTDTLEHPNLSAQTSSNKTSSGGGGGTSGGGGTGGGGGSKSGGGGGGTTVTTVTDPSLAPTDTTTSQLPVADIITVGKWKITSFVQGNDNTTSQFANFLFTFNGDGTMIADDQTNSVTGFWHYQDAVFYYGIPVYGSSPYGFTMTIGTDLPLISLNENYFISKKTLTNIYIDSINPNENAHITFSKLAQ